MMIAAGDRNQDGYCHPFFYHGVTMAVGLFICFEGGEGSGKTTMATHMAEYLRSHGHEVEEVADPGSTQFAQMMRELLLDKSFPCDPVQQVLLYTAARRSLAKEIEAKMKQGIHVISGRWLWSTQVYQGLVQGVSASNIQAIHESFVGLDPDIYVLLDIDPEIALKRKVAQKGGEAELAKDRFESMDLDFHRKIREAYYDVACAGNHAIVDTGQMSLTESVLKVKELCKSNYHYRKLTKEK